MKTFPWKLDFEISHKTERFGLNCSNAFNEHQLSVICTEFPLLAGLFSIFLMMYKAVIAWENIISGLICAGLTHTSHCMRFLWATYVCASWWVLVFEDLTSSLESCKKTFFLLGQWSIFVRVLLFAVRSSILLPLFCRSAECIQICDVRKPERERARARTEHKQEGLGELGLWQGRHGITGL